ncbi:GtrA family protein [Brucella anthropi]|uniref:GtrA family protein n=1 Tax=Brucella anthropi TaxID=529 RepID=UPI000F65E0D6|nr:GtrA family protein [Brucella anthropi]RRY06290.1 hypothetical protein EGJ58_19045 [Brucella anthropi]UGQ21735.1 GtrA family protein [Brucella anthropi]
MKKSAQREKACEAHRKPTLRADGVRFIGAGLVNTVLTFLVFQLLLWVMSPGRAYALAWLVGLAFVVSFYPGRVFSGGEKTWLQRSLMGVSYALVFVVGFFALKLLVYAGISSRIAILVVIVLTTAVNFVSGRLISYIGFTND